MKTENIINRQYYILKISLDEIEPEIWRRFRVPSDIPLDYLHDVIQIIMNWLDYHLHQFVFGSSIYSEIFDSCDFEMDEKDESGIPLSRLLKKMGQSFSYIYDYGDNWKHNVVLEAIENNIPDRHDEIECLAGKRATPPEDVGGISGYFDFCRVMKDKFDEEHDQFKTWYESFGYYNTKFKSESFNLDRVLNELRRYVRIIRYRKNYWSV